MKIKFNDQNCQTISKHKQKIQKAVFFSCTEEKTKQQKQQLQSYKRENKVMGENRRKA